MDTQDKNGGPNHLRAWREFRGRTQAELAEKVGTNSNMIGYLESGERGLSAKWLRKLADALLSGHIELDEAYVGGRRSGGKRGRGGNRKRGL